MENFQELREKIKGLGFKEVSFETFGIATQKNNIFEYIMESLNILFTISEKREDIFGKSVVFYVENSEFPIGEYSLQEAYEKIENEFKEKLTFKAFNSHLFKEVETPKGVTEPLNKNSEISNLMVCIENNTKLISKPITQEGESFTENLSKLHKLAFYNIGEDSRNKAILNSYIVFIRDTFGINLQNNKVPKDFSPPREGYTLNYLKVVAAYQLLLEKGVIKEN